MQSWEFDWLLNKYQKRLAKWIYITKGMSMDWTLVTNLKVSNCISPGKDYSVSPHGQMYIWKQKLKHRNETDYNVV